MEEKKDYNNIPVYYCKNCLSLKVVSLDNGEFCDDCGSMDISKASIEAWEALYETKYGHKFKD